MPEKTRSRVHVQGFRWAAARHGRQHSHAHRRRSGSTLARDDQLASRARSTASGASSHEATRLVTRSGWIRSAAASSSTRRDHRSRHGPPDVELDPARVHLEQRQRCLRLGEDADARADAAGLGRSQRGGEALARAARIDRDRETAPSCGAAPPPAPRRRKPRRGAAARGRCRRTPRARRRAPSRRRRRTG